MRMKNPLPKAQDIENEYKYLVGESLELRSHIRDSLLRYTPQDGLLGSELSSSLRKIRFSKQEFPAGTPVSNIKYYHL